MYKPLDMARNGYPVAREVFGVKNRNRYCKRGTLIERNCEIVLSDEHRRRIDEKSGQRECFGLLNRKSELGLTRSVKRYSRQAICWRLR